jgi:hypothetical protein
MWKILRRDLGLSLRRTEATLVELIERLVEPDTRQLPEGELPSQARPRRRKRA